MTLTEKLKLYADGDKEEEFPCHGFDFSYEDSQYLMDALRIVWLLSQTELVHNYQAEREDLRNFCIVTNGIIRIAKNFTQKCPLKAQFRLAGERADERTQSPMSRNT